MRGIPEATPITLTNEERAELEGLVPDFFAHYPKVEIELTVTDRIVDLLADNADVAIRTGTIDDPSLVVRKIAHVERGIFASPAISHAARYAA